MDRITEILALLENPSELTDEQIGDLDAELVALATGLVEEGRTPETVQVLEQIKGATGTLRTLAEERINAQAETDEATAALLAEIAPAEPEPAEEPVAEVEEAEETVEAPAVEETTETTEVVAEPEKEPVAAAAPKPTPAAMKARIPAANQPRVPAKAKSNTTVTAVIAAQGRDSGRELHSTEEAAAVVYDAFKRFGTASGPRQFVPLIHMENEQPRERQLNGDSTAIIAAAQASFAEQYPTAEAITAAGGVCGPATPYYEQQVVSTTGRPVRDALLGFSGSRGAITFVPPPQLAAIGTSGGSPDQSVDVITNTEDAADTTKPHEYFTCGTPETVTVDAITAITEFGNLMQRTAPEQVAAIMANVMAAHARLAERQLLTAIGSASTAVASSATGGLGSTRDLLGDWARAAEGLRYRHRAPGATLQMIAPYTVVQQMANDLTRGAFGPGDLDNFGIAESQIRSWLSARNISVTFSYEKASGDLYATQAADQLRPWPTSVIAYMFFPGSFGFVDGGTLDLGVVRDSTLNAANKFQMQVETFEAVAAIGVESLQITSAVCNSGGSMGTNDPDEACDDGGS